ncbi:hypothetical protein HKD37_18G050352 [Glycine soja]
MIIPDAKPGNIRIGTSRLCAIINIIIYYLDAFSVINLFAFSLLTMMFELQIITPAVDRILYLSTT